MKNVLKLAIVSAAVMIIIPLLVLFLSEEDADKPVSVTLPLASETSALTPDEGETPVDAPVFAVPDHLRILDAGTGEVVSVYMRDYVIGAVMAEMPAAFPTEALAAQAAAVLSYAYRQAVKGEGAYYDISNAAGEFIAYFNETQGRAFYTDGYDKAYETIAAAVDAVMGYAVVYGSEPIIAAYHSASPGMTESAANVWGADVEYLVPVTSEFDKEAPVYSDRKVLTSREVKARIKTALAVTDEGQDQDEAIEYTEAESGFTGDPAEWFSILTESPSGTILTMTAGEKTITGRQLREALNLKSASFTILYDNESDEFTFTTRGYGHGVGLSQYGAKYLAEQGYNWEEIIKYYYKGVEIVHTKAEKS